MILPLLIISVLLVSLVLAGKYLRNPASMNPQLSHIPGPKPDMLLGNMRQMKNAKFMAGDLHRWAKEFGDVYVYYLFSKPVVVVSDPKMIRKLTVDRDGYQRGQMPWGLVSEFTGRAIFTMDGEMWKHRRSLLNNLFQIKTVNSLAPVISERAEKLASMIEDASKAGTFTEMVKLFHPLTLDVIGVFLMGKQLGALEAVSSPTPTFSTQIAAYFHEMIPQMRNLVFIGRRMMGFTPSFRKFQRDHANLYWKLISNLVEERARELEAGDIRKQDLIDSLLNPDAGLTHAEICHELSGFILAGHETTANSLALVIAELLQHPDKLAEVLKELDRVFPGSATETSVVPVEDVKKLGELKYLVAVIKETLRLNPLVTAHWGDMMVDRQVGDYLIPAGTSVQVSIWNSQYNEKYFPEPEKFLPERFLAEEATDEVAVSQNEELKQKNSVQEAWMPFYAGPHLCIGMNIAMLELKMVLAFFFKNFVLSAPVDYKPVFAQVLTVTVANGLPLQMTRRVAPL